MPPNQFALVYNQSNPLHFFLRMAKGIYSIRYCTFTISTLKSVRVGESVAQFIVPMAEEIDDNTLSHCF